MLVLEMAVHLLQPRPHAHPLVCTDPAQEVDEEPPLERVVELDEQAELAVVEHVLERELDVVADDHGHAVAGDGVEQAVGGGRVAR